MQPSKARSFYQYLQELYRPIATPGVSLNGETHGIHEPLDQTTKPRGQ